MNDRPETKREKFERLRDARLPKITHAMGILANLGGSAYEASPADKAAVVAELQASVDNVAAEFGVAQAAPIVEEASKPIERPTPKAKVCTDGDAQPGDPAEGGATARSEIAWAFDALQRGDTKLAKNRLKRVIDMWRN